MRAIDKLKELGQQDDSIVSIAKDENGEVYYYQHFIPEIDEDANYWSNGLELENGMFLLEENVKFDSQNWKKCIVSIHI